MTDEELAAIEERAKDQDRLGSTADPATVLALLAEVRRLRVEERRQRDSADYWSERCLKAEEMYRSVR